METLPERSEDIWIFVAQILTRVELLKAEGVDLGVLDNGQLVILTREESEGLIASREQRDANSAIPF